MTMATFTGEPDWVYMEDADGTEAFTLPGTATDDGDNLAVVNLGGFGGKHGLEVGGWPLDWEEVDRLVGVLTLAVERWKGGDDG